MKMTINQNKSAALERSVMIYWGLLYFSRERQFRLFEESLKTTVLTVLEDDEEI